MSTLENNIEQRKMRKGDVKNGKKFFHKDTFKEEEFEVVKDHSNIFLKTKNNVYAGRVREVTDEGFEVSIFLFAMEVKVNVFFKNCIIKC